MVHSRTSVSLAVTIVRSGSCVSSVVIMLSANVEQRFNNKFLTKLGKSATETYNLLTELYRY